MDTLYSTPLTQHKWVVLCREPDGLDGDMRKVLLSNALLVMLPQRPLAWRGVEVA